MIARIIKASVCVIRLSLDNSCYHAQPHPIIVVKEDSKIQVHNTACKEPFLGWPIFGKITVLVVELMFSM